MVSSEGYSFGCGVSKKKQNPHLIFERNPVMPVFYNSSVHLYCGHSFITINYQDITRPQQIAYKCLFTKKTKCGGYI